MDQNGQYYVVEHSDNFDSHYDQCQDSLPALVPKNNNHRNSISNINNCENVDPKLNRGESEIVCEPGQIDEHFLEVVNFQNDQRKNSRKRRSKSKNNRNNQKIVLGHMSQVQVMKRDISYTTPTHSENINLQQQQSNTSFSNNSCSSRPPSISPAFSQSSNNSCNSKLSNHSQKSSTNNNSSNQNISKSSLKHYAQLVLAKVKEKGTTDYNEVANELVTECSKESGKDQKNIKRRVYDALNVLMAINVIYKEKKQIHFLGIPNFDEMVLNSPKVYPENTVVVGKARRVQNTPNSALDMTPIKKDHDDPPCSLYMRRSSSSNNLLTNINDNNPVEYTLPNSEADQIKLKKNLQKLKNQIKLKKHMLYESLLQQIALKNLATRNQLNQEQIRYNEESNLMKICETSMRESNLLNASFGESNSMGLNLPNLGSIDLMMNENTNSRMGSLYNFEDSMSVSNSNSQFAFFASEENINSNDASMVKYSPPVNNKSDDDNLNSKIYKDIKRTKFKNNKLYIPFMFTITNKDTNIDCLMTPDEKNYKLTFNQDFRLVDDIEILQEFGLTNKFYLPDRKRTDFLLGKISRPLTPNISPSSENKNDSGRTRATSLSQECSNSNKKPCYQDLMEAKSLVTEDAHKYLEELYSVIQRDIQYC